MVGEEVERMIKKRRKERRKTRRKRKDTIFLTGMLNKTQLLFKLRHRLYYEYLSHNPLSPPTPTPSPSPLHTHTPPSSHRLLTEL